MNSYSVSRRFVLLAGSVPAIDLNKQSAQNGVLLFCNLIAKHISEDVHSITTLGYWETGIGAARYVRSSLQVTTLYRTQSADGAWWQLSEKFPSLEMFGARDDAGDETNVIQSALDYFAATGGGVLTFTKLHLVRPASQGGPILKVPSNVVLNAKVPTHGVKVSDSAGNYSAVFGEWEPDGSIRNITFDGFQIHQNAAGNVNCDVTPHDQSRTLAAIWLSGPRITIQNLTFQNAPGVNTVILNGAAMSQCVVSGCIVNFLKGASSSGLYDNSAFYLNGNDWRLENNECYNLGKHGDARTAFEGHGRNYVMRGNRCYDYSVIANVVSESPPTQDFTNATIEDNCGVRARNGIFLWALKGSFLKSVTLRRNKAFCQPELFPRTDDFLTGFGLFLSDDVTGDYSQIESSDNFHSSSFFNDERVGSGSAGFQWEAIGNIDVVSRNDRTVGAPNIGLSVYSHRGTAHFEIVEPVIEDAGNNRLSKIRQAVILRGSCVGHLRRPKIVDSGVTALNGLNGVSLNFLMAGSDVVFEPRLSVSVNRQGTLLPNRSGLYDREFDECILLEGDNILVPISGGQRKFVLNIREPSKHTIYTDQTPNPVAVGSEISIAISAEIARTNLHWGSAFEMSHWTDLSYGQSCVAQFRYDGRVWNGKSLIKIG